MYCWIVQDGNQFSAFLVALHVLITPPLLSTLSGALYKGTQHLMCYHCKRVLEQYVGVYAYTGPYRHRPLQAQAHSPTGTGTFPHRHRPLQTQAQAPTDTGTFPYRHRHRHKHHRPLLTQAQAPQAPQAPTDTGTSTTGTDTSTTGPYRHRHRHKHHRPLQTQAQAPQAPDPHDSTFYVT